MSAPKVGDLVTIEIRNVKVDRVDGCEVFFTTRAGGQRIEHAIHVGPGWPDATVTTLAPAEWPPLPGDLWRDKHGALWVVYRSGYSAATVTMHEANGPRWSEGHEGQIEANGPWALVHRELVIEQCDECETTGRNCAAHRGGDR